MTPLELPACTRASGAGGLPLRVPRGAEGAHLATLSGALRTLCILRKSNKVAPGGSLLTVPDG